MKQIAILFPILMIFGAVAGVIPVMPLVMQHRAVQFSIHPHTNVSTTLNSIK